MANIKFNVKLKNSTIKKIEKASKEALFLTAEALHTEVVQAQVMPFDTGTMQNTATSVQKINDNHVVLQTVTPYAQRLYYHPEYDFNTASNPDAQGRWLDRWISGSEKDWCQHKYEEIFKRRGGF